MYQTILHEWFEEIWTRGNGDAAHRLLAPDAVIHNLDEQGGDARGPEEFLAFWTRLRSAFPDTRIDMHEVVANGELIAGRWTMTATHHGNQLGFDATGRPVEVKGMCMATVRDGKVVEAWNLFDAMGMMRQLGFTLAQARAA
jgi:steroid delta-isomerase-like uncharacterized protein